MNFNDKYADIRSAVREDLDYLEKEIQSLFSDKTPLDIQLAKFLAAPSKRLRPLLGFLFLRCLFDDVSEYQHEALLAIELIHNATLIHDDVIDKSTKRRSLDTLNAKFDNDLAVVAGDFLLSIAMERIIKTKSIDVLEIFTDGLKSTCMGEINQYFSKFKITTIDQYIEKSKQKTALLFQTGILSCLLLSKEKDNKDLLQIGLDFSQNFGIAFQIRDDLINVLKTDNLKPTLNDLKSGIYTASVIFASQENQNILESKNIIEAIKSTHAIEKTKNLMDNYFDKSICAIENLEENKYKSIILELIDTLKASI